MSEGNGSEQDAPSREAIEERAYQLYQLRGEEPGHEEEDWRQAEERLRDEAGSSSAGASNAASAGN